MKKAALVACSDGLQPSQRSEVEQLKQTLLHLGVETVESPFLYARNGPWSGTAEERAGAFNGFMRDETVDALFDLSGGDLAGELVDRIDYAAVSKPLWGYSDLTCLLNAIYAGTGREGVLYQMRFLREPEDLFTVPVTFVQGSSMEGTLVGGNIRCFLKLAGTPWFPDLTDKILLLEAMSGREARIAAYLSQLRQLGAFEKIRGVVLGTFTELEQRGSGELPAALLREQTDLPIARTPLVGHGRDARAMVIGRWYHF